MRPLIVILLSLAVLGSAAYFGYELVYKKRNAVALAAAQEAAQEAQQAAEPTPAPTPEPGIEEFDAAIALAAEGKLGEAQIALTEFIRTRPDFSKIQDVIDALGRVNMDILFSRALVPYKKEYVVVSGDTLSRIAGKTKTTAELIMRINGLDSTMLRIGDRLLVPEASFDLRINTSAKILDLYKDGVFFKRYRPISMDISSGPREAKVTETIAWREGKRVAFGSPEFVGSTRWVQTDAAGVVLYEAPAAGEPVHVTPPSGGIRLASDDLRELHAIARRGMPVIIE